VADIAQFFDKDYEQKEFKELAEAPVGMPFRVRNRLKSLEGLRSSPMVGSKGGKRWALFRWRRRPEKGRLFVAVGPS
jgi:hypothetical protein